MAVPPRRIRSQGGLVAPAFAALSVLVALGGGCRKCGRATAGGAAGDAAVEASASAPESSASPRVPAEPSDASLEFEILDAASGAPMPGRLTFFGIDGTPDPVLGTSDAPREIEGGVAAYGRVFSFAGRGSVRVPRGTYDVWLSRGPEWTIELVRGVRVGAGVARVGATLQRALETPGWLSADFHVHARPSWDSKVPLGARVCEFVAEGVDALIATDHNHVTDYAPEIARWGAGAFLGTVSGAEISTTDWGHFGAFPVAADPSWWVLHGIRMNGLKPRELLAAIRKHAPRAVITVNHPRAGKMGYFQLAELNRNVPKFARPEASFEFDAVEVLNGYKDGRMREVDAVLADWHALLRSGRRVTAVGNSDTHHLSTALAGYPRNWVQVTDDRAQAVNGEALATAVRDGRSFFSTGPFVAVDVQGKSFGELVATARRPVKVRVTISAAPWISVTRGRVYLNGRQVEEWTVPASGERVRSRREVELSPSRDAFVTVRVDGELLPPIVGDPSHRLAALAVTNPVYLDVDGNGRFDRPR